jgi:hypothetical protein
MRYAGRCGRLQDSQNVARIITANGSELGAQRHGAYPVSHICLDGSPSKPASTLPCHATELQLQQPPCFRRHFLCLAQNRPSRKSGPQRRLCKTKRNLYSSAMVFSLLGDVPLIIILCNPTNMGEWTLVEFLCNLTAVFTRPHGSFGSEESAQVVYVSLVYR